MTPTHSNLWFSNLSVALQVGRIYCRFTLTIVFILLQWSVCRCGKTTGWLLGQNVLLGEKMKRMMNSGSKIKLFAVVRDTEKSWGLTALAWNDPSPVFFPFPPPACSWYMAPSSTRFTHKKMCCVTLSLSNMSGNSAPAEQTEAHYDFRLWSVPETGHPHVGCEWDATEVPTTWGYSGILHVKSEQCHCYHDKIFKC